MNLDVVLSQILLPIKLQMHRVCMLIWYDSMAILCNLSVSSVSRWLSKSSSDLFTMRVCLSENCWLDMPRSASEIRSEVSSPLIVCPTLSHFWAFLKNFFAEFLKELFKAALAFLMIVSVKSFELKSGANLANRFDFLSGPLFFRNADRRDNLLPDFLVRGVGYSVHHGLPNNPLKLTGLMHQWNVVHQTGTVHCIVWVLWCVFVRAFLLRNLI